MQETPKTCRTRRRLTACSPVSARASAGVLCEPDRQVGGTREIQKRLGQVFQLLQRQGLHAGVGGIAQGAAAVVSWRRVTDAPPRASPRASPCAAPPSRSIWAARVWRSWWAGKPPRRWLAASALAPQSEDPAGAVPTCDCILYALNSFHLQVNTALVLLYGQADAARYEAEHCETLSPVPWEDAKLDFKI